MADTPFQATVFDVGPEHTGRSYRVTVEQPNRYVASPDKSYPMVVVLDGQWVGGLVRDAFRILPVNRELPEAVVVGVEHLTADFPTLIQNRAADFSPTKADSPPETGVRLRAEDVGGAAEFRRMLLDVIVARVAEGWRVNTDRTLVGHSFSALFGVDTLLTEPDAFQRWVLTSPSVWWDDRVIFDREAEHASRCHDIASRVYLSVGADEAGGERFSGHEAFHRQLAGRGYPGLDLHWELFAGETHQSVIAPSVSRGLRAVFS